MKNKIHILIIVGILLVAFVLRAHQYYEFPIAGETADEYAWTYLGSSLIQDGQPSSWSYFGPYQPDYVYQHRENEAPIVRPALDHPPLFSFLPGLAHSLRSNWIEPASIKVVRAPLIILGTLNVLLLYFVSRKLFSKPYYRLLATAIYATAPTILYRRFVCPW